MESLATWSVDTLNLQTGYLASKIDYIDTKLGLMQEATPTVAEIVAGINGRMSLMSKEMQGFAQASNFDVMSRMTARNALEEFVQSADHVGTAPNLTNAFAAFDQVSSLHMSLKDVGRRKPSSRMDVLLQKGLAHMEQTIRLQMGTLGIYRQHSIHSQRTVRAWTRERKFRGRSSSAAVLVDVDKLWWRLRNMLDDSNEKADEQVTSFQNAYKAMADYRGCSLGFSVLTEKYNVAVSATEKAHAELHKTWRESNNLLGELASTIVDGEAFDTFFAEQGCNSTLADETLRQARIAVGGMRMLLSRYEAGGIKSPDTDPLVSSVQRIQNSYQQSRKECEAKPKSNKANAGNEIAEEVAKMEEALQMVKEKLASLGTSNSGSTGKS
jgi:hypothetical protein